MTVKLISVTQPVEEFTEETGCGDAEELISYCARVSNPSNQNNFDTADKLLKYCIRKKHWSIFEMADATFEINCTRDIGRQILRHRSAHFQEFSQRYAIPKFEDFVIRECRFQDENNRQSSIEVDITNREQESIANVWKIKQQELLQLAIETYKWAIDNKIAKEQARVVLPEGMTPSTMYMKMSVRDWVMYISLREKIETQKEHRLIAQEIKKVLVKQFPFLLEAFGSAEWIV